MQGCRWSSSVFSPIGFIGATILRDGNQRHFLREFFLLNFVHTSSVLSRFRLPPKSISKSQFRQVLWKSRESLLDFRLLLLVSTLDHIHGTRLQNCDVPHPGTIHSHRKCRRLLAYDRRGTCCFRTRKRSFPAICLHYVVCAVCRKCLILALYVVHDGPGYIVDLVGTKSDEFNCRVENGQAGSLEAMALVVAGTGPVILWVSDIFSRAWMRSVSNLLGWWA